MEIKQKSQTKIQGLLNRSLVYYVLHSRPVNLYPLFLFWKLGSVCDPEKKSGPKKSRVQKNRVIVIQKEKRPGCFFSFWITMTLFFCTLLFLDLIFFQGHKPTHVFKTRIVGADWLGEYLARNKGRKKQWKFSIIFNNDDTTIGRSHCVNTFHPLLQILKNI